MSTSISAVGAGSTAASEMITKKCTLSETTKAKLEALGITVTDGMTESEAQAKISQAEAQQQSQNEGGQQQNSSESEILDDIGAELEVLLEEAQGNPTRLSTLSSYLSELTSLDSQYDSVQSSQQSMYAAMNMVSTNNKIALGLS